MYRRVSVVALGVFFLCALAFMVMVATDPGDVFAMVEADIRPGQSGSPFVTGTVRNRGDSLYSDVQFEIQLLDEDSVVGKTYARELCWWWRDMELRSADHRG